MYRQTDRQTDRLTDRHKNKHGFNINIKGNGKLYYPLHVDVQQTHSYRNLCMMTEYYADTDQDQGHDQECSK